MNLNVIKFKINKRIIKFLGDKTYKNYAEALKECTSDGYENTIITNILRDKSRLYRQNLAATVTPHMGNLNIFPLVSLINSLPKKVEPIHVIDFGGADGGHYLLVRQLLNPSVKLKWEVVETAALTQTMQEFSTDELAFSDDLDAALQKKSKIDILHTSGTIQCVPNPYEYIEKLINSGADYLVFNRQSLNTQDYDVITIQRSLLSWHGSDSLKSTDFVDREVKYPHTSISLKKFEELVQRKYTILYTFEESTGVKKTNREPLIGRSYILKKR
jgi:putative methyltransferase (TIGR04325 family)